MIERDRSKGVVKALLTLILMVSIFSLTIINVSASTPTLSLDNEINAFTLITDDTYDYALGTMSTDVKTQNALIHIDSDLVGVNDTYLYVDLMKENPLNPGNYIIIETITYNLKTINNTWIYILFGEYSVYSIDRLKLTFYGVLRDITTDELTAINDTTFLTTSDNIDTLMEFVSQSYEEGYAIGFDEGYSEGYTIGQNRIFNYGSEIYDFNYINSYDYLLGYESALIDGNNYADGILAGYENMYDNGSGLYDYDPVDSYDYGLGYDAGSLVNVNAGATTFMTNFDTWIVPAIVIVILLGGFISIYAIKQGQGSN